jgi:hypothetical protein
MSQHDRPPTEWFHQLVTNSGCREVYKKICWQLQANRYTKSLLIQILFVDKALFLVCASMAPVCWSIRQRSTQVLHRSTIHCLQIHSYQYFHWQLLALFQKSVLPHLHHHDDGIKPNCVIKTKRNRCATTHTQALSSTIGIFDFLEWIQRLNDFLVALTDIIQLQIICAARIWCILLIQSRKA